MIKIPIKAEGVDDVKAALRSIKDAYIEIEHAAISSSAKIAAAQLHDLDRVAAKRKAGAGFDAGVGRGGSGGGGSRGAAGGGGTTGGDLFGVGNLESSINKAVGEIGKLGVIGIGLSALKGGLDMATEALKTFGGFVINEIMAPAMRLDTKAQQVANASGGKLTADFVTDRARMYGRANNLDPEKLIGAAGAFQDATGESKMGFELLNVIGTLSKSRGYDPSQLASMAGSVYKQGMTSADVEKILLMQTAQGDMGSVTLGEMAKMGGKLTAPAASFAGDYATRIAMSGALLQSSRRGFGSTDEAATGLAAFTSDALKSGKRFSPTAITKNEAGVEQITDPAKLIAGIFRKTSGNTTALRAAGFSDPSMKLVGSFQERFSSAYGAAKEGGASDADAKKSAAAAVEEFIKTFVSANTTMESESANRDKVMATSAEQWDTAIAQMKEEVLKAKPALEQLVRNLVEHAPDIGKAALTITEALISVADWIDEHFGGGDMKRSSRRRDDFERGQDALDRDIATAKAAGGDTSALEKEKATKAAVQQRTEDTLSALTAIPLDQDSKYAANLRAAGGEGIGANGEVSPEAATKNYERVMSLIRKDPSAEIGSYASGSFSPAQTEVLEKYRLAQLGDMQGNIEGGAKAVDPAGLQAAMAKATAEFEKMAGAAQALNRSKAFGEKP